MNSQLISRRAEPRYDVVEKKEEQDEAKDEIAHELAIALARVHHVVDTLHAARQHPRRAVKVTVLSTRMNAHAPG